ncbi:MAG: membrane protein [Gammaproteobacteria bacterium]
MKINFNIYCYRALLDVSKKIRIAIWLGLILLLASCATPRPDNVADLCKIFQQYPQWYWATQDVQKKWYVPIAVQMAIVHQESRFDGTARPPRTRLLWVIPWLRPTSAYGYSQALKETWEGYRLATGRHGADRDEFADAVDFIGWYGYQAYRTAGVDRRNAYQLYLAYHEGIGGYQRKSYRSKPWLIHVAHKVQRRADIYQRQLTLCRSRLKSKPWYRFW